MNRYSSRLPAFLPSLLLPLCLASGTAMAAPIDNFSHTPNAAISGHNIEQLTNVTVADCADVCLSTVRSEWCVSFDYYKNTNKCDLSDKLAAEVGGLKTNYSGNPYDHYSLASRDLTQFQQTENAAISGHNITHLSNVTETDCADACLDASNPWCVSFDYFKNTNECDLSDQRASDVGGLKTDYVGNPYNHFSLLEDSLESFTHTADAAISGHNNEHLNNVTAEQCAEACTDSSRSSWCKSFDYYKNSSECDLSDKNADDVGGLKTDYNNNPYDHYHRDITVAGPNPIPGKKHILLIGLDGLRGDSIQCSTCAVTDNMDDLIAGGAFHDNVVAGGEQTTVSGPGWSTVFTGYWDNDHGVTSNSTSLQLQKPHVFDLIKQSYPTATTAIVSDWVNLTTNLSPSNVDYVLKNGNKNSQQATDQVIEWLSWENAPTAIFYYLHNTDVHTNSYDPNSSTYQTAIANEDLQMGQVLTALKNRPDYANEEWLIVVTSDHGGIGSGHGGQSAEERNTFLILNNTYENPGKTAYCSGDLSNQAMLQIDGAAPHILDFLDLGYATAGSTHSQCGQ